MLQVAVLVAELLTGATGEAQRVSRLRQLYAAQHPPAVELLQQPQVGCTLHPLLITHSFPFP